MGTNVRKKIALLTAQPENAYQSQLIKGIATEAFVLDYDLVVFSTFLKAGYSYGFQHGELNIFSLCDADDYDALLIVPEMLELGDVAKKILKQLKNQKPRNVVIIDRESDDYPYVIANDYDGISLIVDHIITEHKCKDIAFLTGPKGNSHAEIRLNAYKDVMKKYNLDIDEDRIFYGDFWYDDGARVVEKLIEENKLPEAICCASETMAIAVSRTLKKNGMDGKVIVTGFDCEGDALRSYHSVTSTHRHNYELGVEAMRLAHSVITGQTYEPVLSEYTADDLILKSCGCNRNKKSNSILSNHANNPLAALKREYSPEISYSAYDEIGFDSGYNFMLEDMAGQENLSDALWTLSWYTSYLGEFDKFSLCLDEEWCNIENYDEDTARTSGYSDRMLLALIQKKDQASVEMNRFINTADVLPEFREGNELPGVFYCAPAHYNEKVIGYTVMAFYNKPEVYPTVYSRWMKYMNVALESLHRHMVTKHMYEMMKKQALMDSLTGVYNRNGLHEIAPGIIEQAQEYNTKLLVITADMNCMKYINDHFGHGEGDFALIKLAEAFLNALETVGGSLFRTGGDEFVYISAGDYGFEEIGEMINKIREEYRKLLAEKEYPSEVALGYSCATINGFETLEKILAPSDNMMYEDKKRIKEESGYQFARK